MRIQGSEVQVVSALRAHTANASAPPTAPMGATAAYTPGTSYDGLKPERAIQIMKDHSLSNISRNELKVLTNQLHDAGVISSEQLLDLNMPNLDQLNAQFGYPVSNPDEKSDFLAELGGLLDATRRLRPNDAVSIRYLERVNDLAHSLASLSG